MIKDNFKIPIKYIDNIPIDQHLITDLELLTTVNEDKQPIYHNIFQPTNSLAINFKEHKSNIFLISWDYIHYVCEKLAHSEFNFRFWSKMAISAARG